MAGNRTASIIVRILVGLLTAVLVVTPARAQTGRVLLDMTIQVLPDTPSGHCLYVEAGRFIVDAHLTGEGRWPVRFGLGPGVNAPASLDLRITSSTPATAMTQVEAGVACYLLTSEARMSGGDNAVNREPLPEQLVTVRLIWLPAS
jgi:hypothetical protein